MTPLEMILVAVAGLGAGIINTIVGSGTLITFPTLVAFGVPPVTATMSNALGLIPGGLTGSFGYRRELAGQRRRLIVLAPASFVGALTGAYLLLHLPEDAFVTIVPVLLAIALVLVVGQPYLQRRLAARREAAVAAGHVPATYADGTPKIGRGHVLATIAGIYLCGVYGGYFTAAQGILVVGVLGILVPDSLQRHNATKNVLSLVVNLVAGVTYLIVGWDRIDWTAVALIAGGSLCGGVVGARVGRRLPPTALRVCIVVLGLVAIYNLLRL
ncbi:sulfite exporter TauE/SafE family protein [Solicola gregarius]|uniref:Probable membrane transporter protein n=1 Tax=Solicola gregarius TaxID=2908642 RepID=A0AA46TKM1_9ACTN|nr:sulfite exporter TauE/SafE family protein [Solicola gregarius]UYM06858.1 sulfite exporter TauE/SafE family protein [Solicola gregarius]